MDKKKYKLDLHSHSIISHDGGITPLDYEELLKNGVIDYIAITDHNETKLAKQLHEKLGNKIIIGEEIATQEGELIGLFLKKTIPQGLSIRDTINQIHDQDGIVYLPHPFETLRKGVQLEVAETIKKDIDIIEIFNARGLIRGKPQQALEFAQKNNLAMAASSDAHIKSGIGTSYSLIEEVPERKTIITLLQKTSYQKSYAPLFSLLFPSINKVKKTLRYNKENK
jgi:predicted metal-dependent phosphoesterase TrpH